MLEIIIVRHGETAFNAAETFRGRADVPLNETGLKQAALVGEYLANEKVDVVYSSPLQRALQTADAIAAPHNLKVSITENLNDIDCGEWEGKTLAEVKEKYEEVYQDWVDTPEQVKLPGGDSLEDVRNRAWPFVKDAVTRARSGRIVMVSHRAVNKVLVCALLGLDNSYFWNFKLDTASLCRFAFDGNRTVLTQLNDTSYLKPLNLGEKRDF
ncbi:MAG: histidine phosphatase family protein [Dehalococcoidales bacterium]|nr:histidine phosphatase family protein [Dehalococcoidales bacterium]